MRPDLLVGAPAVTPDSSLPSKAILIHADLSRLYSHKRYLSTKVSVQ
jgi:hypothetical protein